MTFLAVSVAGSLGAVARYLITGVVQGKSTSDFPLGTMAVNVAGAFGLGLVAGLGDFGSYPWVVAAGFLGGFTTFSTWMVETLGLGLHSVRALLNLAITLVGGVVVAAIGYIAVI